MNNQHGGNVYEIERARPDLRGEIEDYSANINPLGPPPQAWPAVQRAFGRMNRYPDIGYDRLRSVIAAGEGVPSEWILPGNGAADVLFFLARALRPRQAAVVSPAFSEYREACESAGCVVEDVILPEAGGFRPDDSLPGRIPPEAELVFLCTPCNPTGAVCSRPLVERLASFCRERGQRLIVDESFLDFREDCAERTAIPLCAEYRNLLVVKSLTKFYAMAGARIGYAVCADEGLAGRVRRVSPPWMVNAFAEELTAAALRDEAYRSRTRRFIAEQAAELYGMLRELPGVTPYPPGANFVLFRHAGGPPDLKDSLLEQRILIRRCGEFAGLGADWYRVCVSGPEKNARLVRALQRVL